MPHDTSLITTIVAALVLAFIFGAVANRLKMPPIVGYLIAGVCVGPLSPLFVADQTLAPQLAEIGVILLMFGVGLNFSLKDLMSVRSIAIPGAIIRLAFGTAMGFGLGTLLGWPALGSLVFGLALAVSSTVVTTKVLQDRRLVDSDRGRITIGWLVVEDLCMIVALVLIPAFAGAAALSDATPHDAFVRLAENLLQTRLDLWAVIGLTLFKLIAFVGFMVVVGRRLIPYLLHATAHTGSRELFRLAVLAVALGVAAGSAYLFGVSLALGAFFAGMILSESELSQRAAQETLPLRDAFGVLFFVSVGMLFDPSIIVNNPLPILATLAIIIFGKSIVGFLLLVLFRRPVGAALQISAALAQIGEFSFILAALGVGLGVMPEEGRGLILAGAIISIVLNPATFWFAERLRPRLEPRLARRTEPELGPVVPDAAAEDFAPAAGESEDVLDEVPQPTALTNHVVVIGYGRVGTVVGDALLKDGTPFVVVDDAESRVLAARAAGIEVIVGNGATPDALRLANVTSARAVVVGIPNAFEAGQATEQCRKLNAGVKIIARAYSEEEVEYLDRLGADEVVLGEREIGLGMIDWLKGQVRGPGRQVTAPVGPRLSGGDNLLRQARQAQPGPATAAPGVGPLEPVVAMAAATALEDQPALPGPRPFTAIAPPPAVAPDVPPPADDDADSAAASAAEGRPFGPAWPGFESVPEPEAEAPMEEVAAPQTPVAEVAADAAPHWAAASAEVAMAHEAIEPAAPEVTVPPVAAFAPDVPPVRSEFRVVAPDDIIILPPPVNTPAAVPETEPATTFRSEFWDEEEPRPSGGNGAEVLDSGPVPQRLRNVHDIEPEPAVVDDASWLAALERDLFGEEAAAAAAGGPGPIEVPPPTPQPIETPQPQEDPLPPSQPIETPPSREDPAPTPQPIENPQPQEVPITEPPAPGPVPMPPPVAPPTRAAYDGDEEGWGGSR